jgi:flagellar hook-associated protein 3 FlgL
MRITAATVYRDSSASLERASERLLEFQRQVASGKRISRPSDDPTGAAAAVGERSGIAAVEQYARTADSVASRLMVVDTALSDVIDRLTHAQATVIGAQGSAKTPADRESAAQALEGAREAILADLNTSFRGTFVFAGASSTAPPFVVAPGGAIAPYQGAAEEVAVDIGERRAITIAFDGSQVSRGTAAADVFATLDAAIAAARAGDHDALQQARVDLDAAFERVTAAQMRIGTGLAAIEAQQVQLTDRRLAALGRVAEIEDANLAEAITGMSQADAAYRAALGATNQMTRLSLMDYLK